MTERCSTRLAAAGILAILLVLPVSAANSMAMAGGNSQSAAVNTEVATPPAILIRDAAGAPIAGATVTFTVTAGGGTVSPSSVTTGTDGKAAVTGWKLGTAAGSNALTASAANDTPSITFTATGTAGPAAQMAKNAGDGQSAAAGTAVAVPPGVKVLDAYNNPVSGAVVIFSAMPASSLIAGSSQTTGADGTATVGSWTLGTVTGQNTLTATTGPYSVSFSAQATEPAVAPSVSGISPDKGLNTGTITGVTVTGTRFSAGSGSVVLTRTGESNITGSCSWGTSSITCSFPLSGKTKGSWNVLVINSNGLSGSLSGAFTIYSESGTDITISSITPSSGQAGKKTSFTIAGDNFITSMKYSVYLFRSGSSNISADDIDVRSSTSIRGAFDLDDNAYVDTYQLCIRNEFGGTVCRKNAFSVTTNKRGSIDLSSSPSGASILLDGIANGTTPVTLDNVIAGSHKVILRKNGYDEWGKTVNVNEGKTTSVTAKLSATVSSPAPVRTANPAPVQPAAPATAGITTGGTKKPVAKSTIRIPTKIADDPPAAPAESPLDPLVVIGAAAIGPGLAALRRR